MRSPVTVLTATIPGREELLAQTIKSVYEQTVEVDSHLICAQSCTEGIFAPIHGAAQQNQLLTAATTEFVMRLADDDQLLPHHIATVLPYLDDADVCYTFDANHNRPRVDCNGWSSERLVAEFTRQNWIDASAAVIRTSLLRQVGGWPTDWIGPPGFGGGGHFAGTNINCEDWAAWYHLACAGARFVCVPEDTWLYGIGDWGRSSTTNGR